MADVTYVHFRNFSRWLRPFTVVLAVCLVSGCAKNATAPPQTTVEAPKAEVDAAIEAYAERLMRAARDAEPAASTILQTVAQNAGGELWGYEHRFKSRKSLIRKINKILAENPVEAVEDVRINDALRYTILVDDNPPGTYTETLRDVLHRLEAILHRVEQVKNYWPTGDNYSGVNCVLIAPSGLYWELQFHTRNSKKTNAANRAMYEEIRLTTTPIKRKQQLFDLMTTTWDKVGVPRDVLVDKSLHDTEEIITRPRP